MNPYIQLVISILVLLVAYLRLHSAGKAASNRALVDGWRFVVTAGTIGWGSSLVVGALGYVFTKELSWYSIAVSQSFTLLLFNEQIAREALRDCYSALAQES